MRRPVRRVSIAALMLAAGAVIVSGPGTSCTTFAADSLLAAADFCFIFDCTNGALGGTLNPCSGPEPILIDCPPGGP